MARNPLKKINLPALLLIIGIGLVGYLLFHPELWVKPLMEEDSTKVAIQADNEQQSYFKIKPEDRITPQFARAISTSGRTPEELAFYDGRLHVAYKNLNMIDVLDSEGNRQSFFDAYPKQLLNIVALTVDEAGNIYVTDSRSNKILQYDKSYDFQGFFPSIQYSEYSDAFLQAPFGITVARNLAFVTDLARGGVKAYVGNGDFVLSISGTGPENQEKWHPAAVLQTQDGRVLVADFQNKKISVFNCAGKFAYFFENSGNEKLAMPLTMAVDAQGRVHVVDAQNKKIFVYDNYGRFLFTYGKFVQPLGIAVDTTKNRIFIADAGTQEIKVWTY